jgi:hypothetical protein
MLATAILVNSILIFEVYNEKPSASDTLNEYTDKID